MGGEEMATLVQEFCVVEAYDAQVVLNPTTEVPYTLLTATHPSYDPTVGLYLGSYGGSRGGGFSL